MKRVSLLILVGVFFAVSASAEHTRVTYPNHLGIEVLGRGLLYGIQYDRVLDDNLAAGLGFGAVPAETAAGEDADLTVKMIPAYLNYYFMQEQGSIFATAGVTLLLNPGEAKNNSSSVGGLDFSSSGVLPTVGVGYENRSDSGFLFRLTAYGILGETFAPWAGFTFGYSF